MRVGKEKGVSIAPELIGLFFEDINLQQTVVCMQN